MAPCSELARSLSQDVAHHSKGIAGCVSKCKCVVILLNPSGEMVTMTYRTITLTVLTVLLMCSGQALGAAVTPEDRLAQVFEADAIDANWFAPTFLAQVPVSQVEVIVQQYRGTLGDYVCAEGKAPAYTLVFSRGTAPAQIVLDENARIASFWLGLPQTKVADLEEALAGFSELPGQVSVLVASDTGVMGAIAPEARLAVGSTFKLAILAALKDKINSGALAWDTVARLSEKHVSLPTGILQAWPIGTPLTIQTVASLMISMSDNTATDMLIDVVGRETIEAYTQVNRPFLSTREAFALKNPVNESLLDAYRQSDVQAKREMLPAIQAAPLPDASAFSGGPLALDVEWFFSVGELVNLMAHVQDLPLMSINPGVAYPADWQRIAFKGGSEPGVLNLTTWLVSQSGRFFAVSATWNNVEPLDESRFMSLYSSLIQALKQMDARP
jgi:beta-lactamase class A